MNKFQMIRLSLSIAVAICCYGAGSQAVEVDVAANIGTEFTDNAERIPEDGTSERQDRYGLSIAVEQLQRDVEFSVDYVASQTRFNKDTQEDRSTIDGEAFIRYVKPGNPFNMTVSHSRSRVLERPQDRNLLENLDERSILSGVPGIQYKLSPVDDINLSGSISRISYRFDEARDSKQTGFQLQWQHRLSRLDQLSLSFQSVDSEFLEVDGFDYEYDAARIGYSAQLRRLSYSIEIGHIKSTSDGRDDFSGPSYSLDLAYRTGIHDFTLTGRRTITDSSLGDGNQNLFDNATGRDGTSDSFDRFELSAIEVDWSTPILCDRCSFVMSLGYDSETYSEDSLQDNSEKFGSLAFGYSISTFTQLDFSYRRSEQEFDDPAVEDLENDRYELRLGYDLTVDSSVEISLRREERSSRDPLNEYDSSIVGLGFRQNF